MIAKRTIGCVIAAVLAIVLAPYLSGQSDKMIVHSWASIEVEAWCGGLQSATSTMEIEVSAPASRKFQGVSRLDSLDPGSYTIQVNVGPFVGVKRVVVTGGTTTKCSIELQARVRNTQVARFILRDSKYKEPMADHEVVVGSGKPTITDAEGGLTLMNINPGSALIFSGVKDSVRLFVGVARIEGGSTMRYVVDVSGDMQPPPIANGLASWYTMNSETSRLVDAGPLAIHGEFGITRPSSATDRYGAPSGALQFVRATSPITVPHHASQTNLPMTVSFWVKVDKVTSETAFFLGKYLHPSGEGWTIFFENGLLCAGYFREKFSNWSRVNTVNKMDENWHHIVITMGLDQLTLYMDGARAPARPFDNKSGSSSTSTEPMSIGGVRTTLNGNVNGFSGALDDIMIFDRVLNESEIMKLGER